MGFMKLTKSHFLGANNCRLRVPWVHSQRPSPKQCPTIDFETKIYKKERWTCKNSTFDMKFIPNLVERAMVGDDKGGGLEPRCQKSSKPCSRALKKS